VAKKYGVERSKLLKRYRGTQGSHAENMRLLNNPQESALTKYTDGPCGYGLLHTRETI
ncbi:hypothetical protein BU26DRAFT_440777, partial [Trematosphaeria pertusa]